MDWYIFECQGGYLLYTFAIHLPLRYIVILTHYKRLKVIDSAEL
jgi:hypothetical protein